MTTMCNLFFWDERIEKSMDYSPKSFGGCKFLVQTQMPTAQFVSPMFKSYSKESPTIPSNIIHTFLVVQNCSYVNLKQRGGGRDTLNQWEVKYF